MPGTSPPDGGTDLAALDDGDRTFHAPWQARAFAVAVALSKSGTYEWDAFQSRLVEEIDRAAGGDGGDDGGDDGGAVATDAEAAEESYYRRWLAALERILVEDGVVEPDELETRAAAFAEGERDASEWVEGEHHHGHAHGDGHDHDHQHDHDQHGHHEHGHHQHDHQQHDHDHVEGHD